jgi:hypothetical protein
MVETDLQDITLFVGAFTLIEAYSLYLQSGKDLIVGAGVVLLFLLFVFIVLRGAFTKKV